MAKITYTNKVTLNPQPSIADENKVTSGDMNEIKSSVNILYDNQGDLSSLQTTTKSSLVGAVNELKSGEVYSSSEVKTNEVWIDGKPLYRKTYEQNSTGNIDVSSLNIDTGMIDVSHSFVNTGRICPIQLTTTSASNEGQYMVGAFFNGTKTTLTVEKGSALTVSKVVITIEYTKTTD